MEAYEWTVAACSFQASPGNRTQMRIAVVTWSSRKVGGIETYLDRVICWLGERGHDVALWHEMHRPEDRDPIAIPSGTSPICVEEIGIDSAIAKLRDWEPDVIYAHGLLDPQFEARLPTIAPVYFFAHQYHGTCVGGSKTWKSPRAVPCRRAIGWQCLLHYYPHRCGGWHPATMVREYGRQKQRLDTLRSCRGILTHTEHMRGEYLKHGFPRERVHKIPFPVTIAGGVQPVATKAKLTSESPATLLFLGRMDRLKGGTYLIRAAAAASAQIQRPLDVTVAGDGPERAEWQRLAKHTAEMHDGLRISFPGWVGESERNNLFANADLLVVPSLWPEPFGMVGIEAGHFGTPSAAYAVGGIPEWLVEGRNGHLAPGDPPTKQGLAEAIRKCLADPIHYRELSEGAASLSQEYTAEEHLDALLELFSQSEDGGPDS